MAALAQVEGIECVTRCCYDVLQAIKLEGKAVVGDDDAQSGVPEDGSRGGVKGDEVRCSIASEKYIARGGEDTGAAT